ncbi:hypothetical protein I8F94_14195 [Enterococcus gallinarum]|nr:hypothetical protein [Enterococcus gallinarum]
MATKSFTEEYRFTKKNANSLINALSNDKSPRKQLVTNLKVIDDKEKIKNIFLEVIVRWEYRLSV